MGLQMPLDPRGLVAPVLDAAQYQDAQVEAMFRDNLRRQASASPAAIGLRYAPNAPQVQLAVNANNIGGGVTQGLNNAVNNYLQMKDFRQRSALATEAMDAERARQEQQQMQLAEAQRQQVEREQKQGQLIAERQPGLSPFYDAGSSEQRGKIYDEAFGLVAGPLKAGLTERVKSQAETQARLDELDRLKSALQNIDINTPEGQNEFRLLTNFDPVTQADIEEQQANIQGKQLSNVQAGVDAVNAPKVAQLDLEERRLSNQKTRLQNIQLYASARWADDRAAEELRGMHLRNEISTDELSRLQKLPELMDAAMARLESGEGLSGPELFELQTTVNVLAKKDPRFLETFKDFGFIRKDKQGNFSLDQKRFDEYFKGDPFAGLKIKPQDVKGNLVKAPSGKWYDMTTRQEVPAPSAARQANDLSLDPKVKQAAQKTVQQATAKPAAQQTAANPAPVAVDLNRLSPDEQKRYNDLVTKRDSFKQLGKSTDLRQTGNYLSGLFFGSLSMTEERILQNLEAKARGQ